MPFNRSQKRALLNEGEANVGERLNVVVSFAEEVIVRAN
ncbi:hypothetical protein EV292_11911 [Sphingomonas sp. BK235]|nr:hypothetical protein EV292_11911 [Sphingomonas sp. BK235]